MQISQFFLNGDIKGAIAYMREHEEFKDILPAYAAIFEDCKYRTFEIPHPLPIIRNRMCHENRFDTGAGYR